jgi:hypothetical protein
MSDTVAALLKQIEELGGEDKAYLARIVGPERTKWVRQKIAARGNEEVERVQEVLAPVMRRFRAAADRLDDGTSIAAVYLLLGHVEDFLFDLERDARRIEASRGHGV